MEETDSQLGLSIKITTSGPNNLLYLTRVCLITSVQHRCQVGTGREAVQLPVSHQHDGAAFRTLGKQMGALVSALSEKPGAGWTQFAHTRFDLEGLDVYGFIINNHLPDMDSHSDNKGDIGCSHTVQHSMDY